MRAAFRAAADAAEEELQAIETRIDVAEEAADEEACAALKAQAAAVEHKVLIAEVRLEAAERAARACSPVIVADEEGALASASGSDTHRAVPAACGFAMAHSLASTSGFDSASGSGTPRRAFPTDASGSDGAGSVNGGPAKKPRDWRKSCVPKDLLCGA